MAAYPELTVLVNMSYAFEDLQDPAFDLAVRIGHIHDEGLVAKPLGHFRRILVASPQFLERHPVHSPTDLDPRHCLVFSSESTNRIWSLRHQLSPDETIDIATAGRIGVQRFSALANLAEQHQGIGLIPDFIAKPRMEAGQLVRCLPQWSTKPIRVFLAHRFGAEKIQRVKAVLELARKHIPEVLESGHID